MGLSKPGDCLHSHIVALSSIIHDLVDAWLSYNFFSSIQAFYDSWSAFQVSSERRSFIENSPEKLDTTQCSITGVSKQSQLLISSPVPRVLAPFNFEKTS